MPSLLICFDPGALFLAKAALESPQSDDALRIDMPVASFIELFQPSGVFCSVFMIAVAVFGLMGDSGMITGCLYSALRSSMSDLDDCIGCVGDSTFC